MIFLKILIISEHFFPKNGGSVTYVHNICHNLAKLGQDVYLITKPNEERSSKQWYRKDGYNVYHLDIPNYFDKERYFPFFLLREISSIMRDIDPEIIHFAYGHFAPLITLINRPIIKRHIFWTIHNVPPNEHKLKMFNSIYLNNIVKKIYFGIVGLYSDITLKIIHYNKIICVSDKTAQILLDKGISKSKISVLGNGVDTNTFYPLNNVEIEDFKKRLGFENFDIIFSVVARFEPHKGHEYLIKAIPSIIKQYPNALFLLIGPKRSDYYLQYLNNLIDELGVSGNVKMIHDVDFDELIYFYNLTDIYIQPSLEEGFCISVLEAMACGKPVIGTKTGAIPSFIKDSGCGILIDSVSSEQISKGILKMLADDNFINNKQNSPRKYVAENHSWGQIAKLTLDVFRNCQEEK